MLNPGIYSLTQLNGSGDLAIAGAGTTICDVIDDLDGMLAANIWAKFGYGSGGTSCKVYVQTSFDQGTTWDDIACFSFTTVTAERLVNLLASVAKDASVVPTDGSLADDTVIQGALGDRLRVKVVSVGTYANTVLYVRAGVR